MYPYFYFLNANRDQLKYTNTKKFVRNRFVIQKGEYRKGVGRAKERIDKVVERSGDGDTGKKEIK